jgi:hypothetical protein
MAVAGAVTGGGLTGAGASGLAAAIDAVRVGAASSTNAGAGAETGAGLTRAGASGLAVPIVPVRVGTASSIGGLVLRRSWTRTPAASVARKRPAACAPEFRVEVLALSSCSLQIESDARRKRCRCSFEIRGFRRPGNEFRMPCEGPGFRLIQRPIWSGKFELHAHTSRRTVEAARAAGGVFPRSAGRPSPRDSHCSMGTSAPFTQRNRSEHLGDNGDLYQRIDVRRPGR